VPQRFCALRYALLLFSAAPYEKVIALDSEARKSSVWFECATVNFADLNAFGLIDFIGVVIAGAGCCMILYIDSLKYKLCFPETLLILSLPNLVKLELLQNKLFLLIFPCTQSGTMQKEQYWKGNIQCIVQAGY